jgi:hypothetical protein
MLARRWVSRRQSLSQQGSSAATPTLISHPHKGHLFALEDRMSTMGRISTSAPTNRVSSSKLSVPVSQCSVPTFRRIVRAPLLEHLQGTMPLLPPVVILSSDVVRWDTMLMVVPRGTSRILQASSTIVDRGRLHSSNSLGTTTRHCRTTRVSRTLCAGV